MYLSCLEVDTTSRRGGLWLSNPYRVHQRLLMAFDDGTAGRLLFRIEDGRDQPRILVQSETQADWERAFRDHPVLASQPRQKSVDLHLASGQRLRFFVRANPTFRKKGDGDRPGPRLGILKEAEQIDWLRRKGEGSGFELLDVRCLPRGVVVSSRDGASTKHLCVDFEGYLKVTDPDKLGEAIKAGIGSAKGFGFGMLSIAPVRG